MTSTRVVAAGSRWTGFAYRFADFLGLWVHTVRGGHATAVVVTGPSDTWLPGRDGPVLRHHG
jgi:hypothetical protein